MRNLLARLIIAALVVAAVITLVPVSAFATGDPSTTQPTANDTLSEPPLPSPSPTPAPEPPHVPVTYTVGSYVDKSYDASSDGTIKAINVRKVEDLAYIATKLNLTTDEIKYSNPDKDVTSLKEGDTLTVPPVHGVIYKVKTGDTLTWISQSYQVDLNSVVQYNNIGNADAITPDSVFVLTGAKLPPVVVNPVPVATVYAAIPTYSGAGSGPSNPIPYSGSNHFYFGYCTYYVANRRPIPWFGDAIAWWPNARSYGYAEGRTPRPGAILVESPNHVAYVESVGSGSFTVSEMNWSGWDRIDTRNISNNDPAIVGFIY